MTKYLIAMSVRLVCIALCLVVHGWWLVVFAIGAVALPYLAVVLANVGNGSGGNVVRPGSIVPLVQASQRPPADHPFSENRTADHPFSESRTGPREEENPADTGEVV